MSSDMYPAKSYLYVVDDVSEGRGAFSPGPQQLHGLVKVPDVVGIHPQEGCILQQNITQAGALVPRFYISGKVKCVKYQAIYKYLFLFVGSLLHQLLTSKSR